MLQLNDDSIYDSVVCTVLTEVNPTLNPDIFAIYINNRSNPGISGLSVWYLSTREQKGVSVDKFNAKWMININASNSTLEAMA